MRYLGVDPGGRKMGLAVGDHATGVVSPLAVVPYEGIEGAASRIAAAAAEYGAERIVLGLPGRADGTVGDAGKRSRLLAEALDRLGLVVELQNEFLSTDEARRRARACGRPAGRPVDDIAAQVLLEEFLEGIDRPAGTGS
jgi:putative Holliday junction resolvase